MDSQKSDSESEIADKIFAHFAVNLTTIHTNYTTRNTRTFPIYQLPFTTHYSLHSLILFLPYNTPMPTDDVTPICQQYLEIKRDHPDAGYAILPA